MNSSTLNSKYLLILLTVILFILSGCAFGDPVQKTTEYLNSGNITEGVQYYNEHIEKADAQTREEIDKMISDHIDSLIVDWDVSDETTENAIDQLSVFSNINNDSLSASSKEKLDFINRELDGNRLLAEAENCYKQENYLEAMTYLEKADSEYSQYSLFNVLYTDSKLVLLQAIGHPSTISEYETAIDTLNSYMTAVDDPDFRLALSKLENELQEYRNIYNILARATTLYEKGNYKQSFDTLEAGLKKYPKNKKIAYALNSYQYAYVITVCGDVIDLIDNKDYDSAETMTNTAIQNYDCAEFRELAKAIRMKTDILYAASVYASDAGNYIFRSSKKMVLGDFAEDEQETILSLGGRVTASLFNVDAPLDVIDLAHDMTHWGEGDYFAARLVLDAVGVLPLIGVIKYLKYADDASDLVKTIDKAADAADTLHDAANAIDAASDLSKTTDLLVDYSDVISDVRKKTETVADLTDDFSDFAKKADVLDDISDSIRKAEKADDLVDAAKKTDTAGDIAETVVIHYEPIKTINQAWEGKTYGDTGVEFVRKNIDLSDGKHYTGVFPKFDSAIEITLPPEYYKAPFYKQKKYLADQLKEMASTPAGRKHLEGIFDSDQIDDILEGIDLDGFTWHHNETEGVMQLVDTKIHNLVKHTGGKFIWGDGY